MFHLTMHVHQEVTRGGTVIPGNLAWKCISTREFPLESRDEPGDQDAEAHQRDTQGISDAQMSLSWKQKCSWNLTQSYRHSWGSFTEGQEQGKCSCPGVSWLKTQVHHEDSHVSAGTTAGSIPDSAVITRRLTLQQHAACRSSGSEHRLCWGCSSSMTSHPEVPVHQGDSPGSRGTREGLTIEQRCTGLSCLIGHTHLGITC